MNDNEIPEQSSSQESWQMARDERPAWMPTASGHWRPGSPVTPVGSSYRSEANGAAPGSRSGPEASKNAHRWMKALVASVVVASAGLGAGVAELFTTTTRTISTSAPGGTGSTGSGAGGGATSPSNVPSFGSGGSSATGGSSSEVPSSAVSSIAAKVAPGLVDVNSSFAYQRAAGAGTGIVLSSNGEVLTNNHVIDGATKISVTDIGNGKTYAANVVGYDATQDVAVLQLVGASGLAAATLGDSATAAVGESVVGIGNAGGTGGTPTSAAGEITELNRSITAADDLDGASEQLTGLIGVNADIQAGDSGGPLVNSNGEVLGVDVAGSQSSPFQASDAGSQGFAIPINQAMATVKKIEAGKGSSTVHVGATAFLGVLVSSSGASNDTGGQGGDRGYFGAGGAGTNTSGAVIGSVVGDAPAAKAGISAGDVITSVAGKTITSATDLSGILAGYRPGQAITIEWADTTGQTRSATVTLSAGPPA